MVVNDNGFILNTRVVLKNIASKLAPTGLSFEHKKAPLSRGSLHSTLQHQVI
ncbi:UNVERIFIED_ORG: hypothetical protein J2Y76_000736 [Pseudomonas reinekei]|nr:hypothetical protein [Pseudomonas reinekei]